MTSHRTPPRANTMRVKAPAGFANAELNGERVLPLFEAHGITTCMILTGKEAGRRWQFNGAHLDPA